MIYFLLPFMGFLVGLLIISLGGGGGGIYVGILTAIFNVPPAIAASTSLATIIPTTAIGTVSHWKAGNITPRLGFIMLIGGSIGAIVGSLFSDVFPKNLYSHDFRLLVDRRLSKPTAFKVTQVDTEQYDYDGYGVLRWTLVEDILRSTDDIVNMVADNTPTGDTGGDD